MRGFMLNKENEEEEEEEKNEEVVRMMGRRRRKLGRQLCWAILHRSVGQ